VLDPLLAGCACFHQARPPEALKQSIEEDLGLPFFITANVRGHPCSERVQLFYFVHVFSSGEFTRQEQNC
jgi:hypothetical protein